MTRLGLHMSRLRRFGSQDCADMLIAGFELGRARWRLARLVPAEFRSNWRSVAPAPTTGSLAQCARVAQISRAIARVANLVPWRADCLVRAEAGRHWLARLGLLSDIRLGARRDAAGRLDAHAWLICNGQIVTGGDIHDFVPFS